jgi:hypothetical protein
MPYGISNGILSGVPPAAGGAGGVAGAGAGAGVWAIANEPIAATAQAASVIEMTERIVFSQLKFVFMIVPSKSTPRHIGGVNPSLP